jgi:hypothetical protein
MVSISVIQSQLSLCNHDITQNVIVATAVPFRSIWYDPVTVTRLMDLAIRYSPLTTVTSKKFW